MIKDDCPSPPQPCCDVTTHAFCEVYYFLLGIHHNHITYITQEYMQNSNEILKHEKLGSEYSDYSHKIHDNKQH